MGSNSSKGQGQGEFKCPKRPKHLQKRVRDILKQQKQKEEWRMVPPGSPADTVTKQAGGYFVLPFSFDMSIETYGKWPLGGSFAPSKIELLREMVKEVELYHDWDHVYMRECVAKWEEIARKHKPPKVKRKPSSASNNGGKEKCDERLCSVVDIIAAHTAAENVPQLLAALQIQSTVEQKIMNTFPGDVRKQATALIHWWIGLQPHPSVEGLLSQLKCGGLNVDWLIQEKRESPPQLHEQAADIDAHTSAADVPQLSDGGLKEERRTEGGNNSHIIIYVTEKQVKNGESERAKDAKWFLREFSGHFTNMPDPFIKPRDFHTWLRIFCIPCNMTPANINMLLDLAYSYRWKKVSNNFDIPSADWSNIDSLTAWLDGSCFDSIKRTARENVDMSDIQCCYQKPKEPLADFLQRFQQVWDSSVGLGMDFYSGFAVSVLVYCIQSDVAKIFKEKMICWESSTLHHVKNVLLHMEHLGMFESNSRALQPWSRGSRYPRRDKRGDQCFYCGRFGHWTRECRARLRHYALTYEETY
ncbi:uncharacterized protein LOC121903449 isoform X1 [Scomber scombrus]|uniref:Uncharacterized protein LOC121903449 isoform X1 n=1 Tax=Scomber scombrus TaxID=13677 RepID=A0AAV1QB87_SCOSC